VNVAQSPSLSQGATFQAQWSSWSHLQRQSLLVQPLLPQAHRSSEFSLLTAPTLATPASLLGL
jgi:hypothetical protein